MNRKIFSEYGTIALVAPEVEDAALTVLWRNDSAVIKTHPPSAEAITEETEHARLRRIVTEQRPDLICLFHIQVEGTGELIGSISLSKVDQHSRVGQLGLYIGAEDDRNKGYGRDAVRAMCLYGFEQCDLELIILDVHRDNPRAISCYEKCGFAPFSRNDLRLRLEHDSDKLYMRVSPSTLRH